MRKIGIWSDLFSSINQTEAYRIIRNRLLDIQAQDLRSLAIKLCSPLHLQIPIISGKMPSIPVRKPPEKKGLYAC